jgi:FlaA1/EpsC-like NDP-sugar epimerase
LGRAHCRDRRRTRRSGTGNRVCSVAEVSDGGTTIDSTSGASTLESLGVDIAIEYIGLRPGEKLYEELSLDHEDAKLTRHPKIWIGQGGNVHWPTAAASVRELLAAADGTDAGAVRALIGGAVPEYTGVDDVSVTGLASPEEVSS